MPSCGVCGSELGTIGPASKREYWCPNCAVQDLKRRHDDLETRMGDAEEMLGGLIEQEDYLPGGVDL